MKYSEALKLLADSGLENAQEIADAINSRVTAATQAETQLKQSQALLDSLFGTLAVEGESLASKLDNAQSTIKGLKDQKAEFETKYSQSLTELESMKRQGAIDSAAQAIGANPSVLRLLLQQTPDSLEVKDGKPMLGGRDLKEWVEKEHQPFLASLFPASTIPSVPTLPSGTSAGVPPKLEKPSLVAGMMKNYEQAVEKVLGVS